MESNQYISDDNIQQKLLLDNLSFDNILINEKSLKYYNNNMVKRITENLIYQYRLSNHYYFIMLYIFYGSEVVDHFNIKEDDCSRLLEYCSYIENIIVEKKMLSTTNIFDLSLKDKLILSKATLLIYLLNNIGLLYFENDLIKYLSIDVKPIFTYFNSDKRSVFEQSIDVLINDNQQIFEFTLRKVLIASVDNPWIMANTNLDNHLIIIDNDDKILIEQTAQYSLITYATRERNVAIEDYKKSFVYNK